MPDKLIDSMSYADLEAMEARLTHSIDAGHATTWVGIPPFTAANVEHHSNRLYSARSRIRDRINERVCAAIDELFR